MFVRIALQKDGKTKILLTHLLNEIVKVGFVNTLFLYIYTEKLHIRTAECIFIQFESCVFRKGSMFRVCWKHVSFVFRTYFVRLGS